MNNYIAGWRFQLGTFMNRACAIFALKVTWNYSYRVCLRSKPDGQYIMGREGIELTDIFMWPSNWFPF